jgi:uncharacterized protein
VLLILLAGLAAGARRLPPTVLRVLVLTTAIAMTAVFFVRAFG